MKNSRIIKAYDSINPTQDQKQRMLDAILQEAPDLEKPVSRKRTYTAKAVQPNRRTILGPLAASLALFVIGGFAVARMWNGSREALSAPESNTVAVLQEHTAADHYGPVLEKYRRAISQGWTREECEIEGISTRMQAGSDISRAGFAFLDLDGDGREELIIAEESTDRTDNIWDLYTTLEDGTPIQLWVDEQNGGQCKLHEGNILSISDSYKDELELTFYDLASGQLEMREMLQWEDEDTVFYTDADGNTQQVSSREGQEIGYAYELKKLDLTWLSGKSQALPDMDALERYMPVLEKYRTALTEHWDMDKCVEHDISAIVASSPGVQNDLGWCMMDIDGNGTEELIISYGNESGALVDLYSIQPEGVLEKDMVKLHGGFEHYLAVENGICHLAKSEGHIQYTLCSDGTIRYQIVADGTTSWFNYLVKPWGLELQDVMIYKRGNADDKTYSYGPHEYDLTYISKEKAGEFIVAHKPLQLQVTPLVDWDQYELDPKTAYDPIVDLYEQALTEKWDMEQCSSHDISLLISRFADDPDRISAFMMDLDCDGSGELIITDGMMIYDLYTLKNGTPVKLLTGWERNSYRLCMGNVIYNQGSNGAASSVYNYYQLQNGELVLMESVIFDAQKDPENPWFVSSDGITPEVPLREDQARAILDSYKDVSLLGISLLEVE